MLVSDAMIGRSPERSTTNSTVPVPSERLDRAGLSASKEKSDPYLDLNDVNTAVGKIMAQYPPWLRRG